MHDFLWSWVICLALLSGGAIIWALEMHKQRNAYRDEYTKLNQESLGQITEINEDEHGLYVKGRFYRAATDSMPKVRKKRKTVSIPRKEMMLTDDPYYVLNTYFKDWYNSIMEHFQVDGPMEFFTHDDVVTDDLKVSCVVRVVGERTEY